jgi:hypothetical protein
MIFFEFSSIELSDYPLRVEKVKLNLLVQEVLVGFYDQFNQLGLEPFIQMSDGDIVIEGDHSAVKRVVEN